MTGHHLIARKPVRESLRFRHQRRGVLQFFADAGAVAFEHEGRMCQLEMESRIRPKRTTQNLASRVSPQSNALARGLRCGMPPALSTLQCRNPCGVFAETHDEPARQVRYFRLLRRRDGLCVRASTGTA